MLQLTVLQASSNCLPPPSPSRPWTDDPSLSRWGRSDYTQGDWLVFVNGWRSTGLDNMCRSFKMVSVASHMGLWTSTPCLSFVPWMDILFQCSNHIATQSYGALATRHNRSTRSIFKTGDSFEVRKCLAKPCQMYQKKMAGMLSQYRSRFGSKVKYWMGIKDCYGRQANTDNITHIGLKH